MTSNPNPNPNPTPSPVTDRCYGIITLRYAPPPSTLPINESTSNDANPAQKPSEKTEKENLEVLLIHQKTGSKKPPFWAFPKGHPEEGDMTFLGTARREVLEETGLEVRVGDVLTFPSLPLSTPNNPPPTQEPPIPLPSTLKDQDPITLPSTFTEVHTSPGRKRGKVVTYYVALLPSPLTTTTASNPLDPTAQSIQIQNQNESQNQEQNDNKEKDKEQAHQHKITLQEKEIAAAQWLPTHEAMTTLFYPEGKEVLRCVLEALEREGGVRGCGRMGGGV
ncbi:hypothetical protein HYALB_00000682 [Hymenoscyphus albidus]|uniref:Nudix hydrolase domain-containing protein n=1 Tax=Hymenoscyphus albidus TaxID=595503 RepID=A0A9N9LRC9_9HELO|nr:hypothetical protein HYALB_00000682 [Hymenoscyphus albidus]